MRFAIATALLLIAGSARSEQWLQRYHDAQHTSFISVPVDPMVNETFRYVFDAAEVDRGPNVHLIHYTDPKLEDNGDMFVPVIERNGSVVTSSSVRKLSGGVEVWTFPSDWIRQTASSWEPLFDFAVNPTAGDSGIVYAMGKYGCVWILNEPDGTMLDKKCATDPIDPTGEPIYDVSPFTIDASGNVFWTIRSSSALIGSSLVRLDTSGTITAVALADLAGAGQIAAMNSGPAVSA